MFYGHLAPDYLRSEIDRLTFRPAEAATGAGHDCRERVRDRSGK
jgi:hypothetical protein